MSQFPGAKLLAATCAVLHPPTCVVCGRGTSTFPLCFRCGIPPLKPCESSICKSCGSPYPDPTESCPRCERYHGLLRQQRYLWDYEGFARELIQVMKYKPSKALARILGQTVAQALPAFYGEHSWSLIVPIPCSRASLFHRGFDQGILLAEEVLKRWSRNGGPLLSLALTRTDQRTPQAKLIPSRRSANARGALSLINSRELIGARVLLIDDVVTTGATVRNAARLLKRAGAKEIDLLTLARAKSWYR